MYSEKMKTLLWVEELQMEIDIRRYDLVGIEMGMDRDLLILEVHYIVFQSERYLSLPLANKVLYGR